MESFWCFESSHTRFYYLGYILTFPGLVKQMRRFLVRSTFIANNFWAKQNKEKHETPLYSSRPYASNRLHFEPKRSCENLTIVQVQWPDLMNDPGRSCCISVDASWQGEHNACSITPLAFWWKVIDGNVFVPGDDVIYVDVVWLLRGHRLAVALDSSQNCI